MRIPSDRDVSKRIISYGEDNLYPERMEQVVLLSPVAKSAVALIASFIRGDGFENGDEVINERGETANDILKLVSEDLALYNGYGLHLNSTGIGKVKEVQHIRFSFIRLGLPNQRGQIKDVRLSNNWETISTTLPESVEDERRFLIFDQEQNGREALTSAKGMVFYQTQKKNEYPISAIDAIIETCQSDHEIQLFQLGSITNGFNGLSIFKFPSSGDTEDEEQALREKLNGLKGARNSNSVIVASIDEDYEGGNLIENIGANNQDSLFINTGLNIKNTIMQTFRTPASLMGIVPSGFIFAAQQIHDDFLYLSAMTKDQRNEIERAFEKFGLNLGKIKPRKFDVTQETNGNEQGQPLPNEGGSNGL